MKRKSYAKDHVTVRLNFEENAYVLGAIRKDIASAKRDMEEYHSIDLRITLQHRIDILSGVLKDFE